MARGQDQVIPAEVEAGDGGGKERQVPSIRAGRPRQPLDERGDHATPLDDGRDGAGEVEQGEEVGVREELAEGLQTALAAPHAREPVVHQRHLHGPVRVLRGRRRAQRDARRTRSRQ